MISPTTQAALAADEEAARLRLLSAQRAYAVAALRLRAACSHGIVLEASGADNPADGALPVRICVTCGIEEEAWSFRVLTGAARRVTRRDIIAARKPDAAPGADRGA